jgi:hypothetical protein
MLKLRRLVLRLLGCPWRGTLPPGVLPLTARNITRRRAEFPALYEHVLRLRRP